MFKKIMPYNLRKLSLLAILAAMPAFTACEKDDNDPNKDKIEQLKAEVKRLGTEVRLAVEPAKTQPRSISITFNNVFAEEAAKIGGATNIVDSAKTFVPTADRLISTFGDYANPDNMNVLKNKSVELGLKNQELQNLLANQR